MWVIRLSILAAGPRAPAACDPAKCGEIQSAELVRRLADFGAEDERLDVHLGEQPVDRGRIDQPGAEVLHRLGTAGDAVAQAFDRRLLEISRGDIAGSMCSSRSSSTCGSASCTALSMLSVIACAC